MKIFGSQKFVCFANNDHNATLYIVDKKSTNVEVTIEVEATIEHPHSSNLCSCFT
jgi:hypothetical protein